MKVPQYEQKIEPQTTQIRESQGPGLSIPREVFAGDSGAILQNIENVGKTAEAIGGILQKRADQQNEVRNLELMNQFDEENQKLLLNPDPNATRTIIDSNGKEQKVPIAALNTVESQAAGSSEYLEQAYAKLYSKYSQLQTNPIFRAKLQQKMNSTHSSDREAAIRHEVAQMRVFDKNTTNAQIANIQDRAMIETDPNKLKESLTTIIDINNKFGIRQGEDMEVIKQKNHDDIEKALWNATDGVLESTGSVDEAKTLLNDPLLKDLIPEDLYEKTEVKLEQRGTRIKKQYDREVALADFAYTSTTIKDIASGRIDLNDPSIDAVALSGGNTKLGIAIKTVQADKGHYTPIGSNMLQDLKFQEYVKDVFATNSKEKISNLLIDALNAHGNKEVSQEKLNILVDAAMNQASILPLKDGEELPPMTTAQAETIAGIKLLNDWSDSTGVKDNDLYSIYLTARSNNIPVEQAFLSAMKYTAIKKNPVILSAPVDGEVMIDSQGNTKLVFPDGHYEAIAKPKGE